MEIVKHSLMKRKLEQQHLQRISRTSIVTTYGIVARNLERTLLIARDLLTGKHRERQINKSPIAQRFVLRKLETLIQVKTGQADKIGEIRRYIETHKDKEGFMAALKEATKQVLGVEQSKEILGVLYQHITEAAFGKHGIIYDPHENTIYTQKGTYSLGDLDNTTYVKVVAELRKYGINIKKTYFEMKHKQIILEAISRGRTPKEIQRIYLKLHREALQKDQAYREGYVEKIKEEIRRTAQLGGLFYGLHSFFTRLPSMIVSMLSRMLSQVLRMLPILGSVAAVSAEAAQIAVGLGEELRNRIEQSSHVFHSLPSQYLGDLGKQIEQQQAQYMQAMRQ